MFWWSQISCKFSAFILDFSQFFSITMYLQQFFLTVVQVNFWKKQNCFVFEIIWINLKLKIVLHRHWKPMNKICSFCSRTYDYILRYEHLTMETQQFLKYLNLDHIIPPTVNFQIYFCNKRYSLLSSQLAPNLGALPFTYSVCCYG